MSYLRKRRPGHRVTLMRRKYAFEEEDISALVTGIRTSKTVDQPSGSFFIDTIECDLYKTVVPNDVILIEFDAGDGNGFVPDMLGVVSRASRGLSHQDNGSPVYTCQLSGQDFGKLLSLHDCGADMALVTENDGATLAVRLSEGNYQFTGCANENLKDILDNLFFGQLGWTTNFMTTSFSSNDTWQTKNVSISQKSGSVWSAMKNLANEPWNVLFTQTTKRGKFEVCLKRRPIKVDDTGLLDFDLIDKHEIADSILFREDMGVGDADRINYISFENYVNSFGSQGQALVFMRFNRHDAGSINIHGFCPFRPKTNYVPPLLQEKHQNSGAGPENIIRDRTNAMWNWYRRNHTYESGSIQLAGDPNIKIMSGIVLTERGKQYLVEGVSHNYQISPMGTSFVTSLNLTRGQAHYE